VGLICSYDIIGMTHYVIKCSLLVVVAETGVVMANKESLQRFWLLEP